MILFRYFFSNMAFLIKNANYLPVIAGVGLAGCIGISYISEKKFIKSLENTIIYKDVIDRVSKYHGTIKFLGEPLKVEKIKYKELNNIKKGLSEVQVKVTGPKSWGIIFFTVTPVRNNEFELEKIHLQIGNDVTKRLVIPHSSENSIIVN